MLIPISGIGDSIVLKDTAANLAVILPQLTQAQLASFTSIEILDNNVLDLDPSTFARLDTAAQVLVWTNRSGISLTNSNGSDVAIRLVADQLSDLVRQNLISGAGQLVDKLIASVGQNLAQLVNHIVIKDVVASDSTVVKTLSNQAAESSTL